MQKILVLGAGMVAGPLVKHLLAAGYGLTVTSLERDDAVRLIDGHPAGEPLALDFTDQETVRGLVARSDLVVSLLPPPLHPQVAELCLQHGKHLVTCSYVSPELAALDAQARAADLILLSEIGLDPGIDHLSAMRVIDGVRARGGRIEEFRSYCGGLPAPEANDNPFGYKFSWAPRGVLMASRNGALYLRDGDRVEVVPERLFRDMHLLHVAGAGDFEAYPNRDSLSYIDVYELQGVRTMIRATLRNPGWCDTMFCLRKAGLLELEPLDVRGLTYAQLAARLLGAEPGEDLRHAAARRMQTPVDALPPWNLHWLGFFSDRPVGVERTTALDAIGRLMLEKLRYRPGERDMVVLTHHFVASFDDGHREKITSTLVDFGTLAASSMARTVSLPAALACELILAGKISGRGVLRPVTREFYDPILAGLAKLDIVCREDARTL